MPKLHFDSGPMKGETFSFDRAVTVGRGPLADLQLADPRISRRHAILDVHDKDCVLHDLDSENGSYVNALSISEPRTLTDGDSIRWGGVRARFEADVKKVGEDTTQTGSVVLREVWQKDEKVLLSMAAEAHESPGPTMTADPAQPSRVQFLSELAESLSETLDEDALLTLVLGKLFEILPQAERAFAMRWNTETEELEPASVVSKDEGGETAASRTLLNDVVTRREGILVADAASMPRYAQALSMQKIELRTAICAPMLFHDVIYGVLQVDSTRSAAPFDKADLSLLIGVARQVAMTLAYSKLHGRLLERQLLERDVALARRIQQHFLPKKAPKLENYSFAYEYTPALALGGDFFTFLDLGKQRFGIAVGDVSGKGISAALYMAKVASELRYQAADTTEPATILNKLNAVLAPDAPEGMFITLVVVAIDLGTGHITVANGGHLPPLVREASGQVVSLGETGDVPLGVSEHQQYRQSEYVLDATDRVLLFTDGITEATSANEELFGDERLHERVRDSDGTTHGIVDSILLGVKDFVKSAPQMDDITLVCFGRS
jgi:serine phosphatase RsbU (regulator of sigma subunit)/pSer/pThr/pTyr-binding forkhead associated (FHA) protein